MTATNSKFITYNTPFGVKVSGRYSPEYAKILSQQAIEFLSELHWRFEARRRELLLLRAQRQTRLDAGQLPDFLPETAAIREGDWKIAPLPADLLDRRVEITGPVERKMVINALNSGARVFMADFEDSNAPSWDNVMQGQINLRDAVRREISYRDAVRNKDYTLNPETAVLFVRPRGWHMEEKHFSVDGSPMSASLFDFGLFFFHNAQEQIRRGTGPYFYLPKMESHLEARLWNDVFVFAQNYMNIPQGTIKATVLIETILASFELNEILYELREHSAGLNCGRWDYIFSFIKKFRNHPQFCLPDRAQVTMTTDFMRAYSLLVIKTCHRRGAPAMGGMAAQIPIKDNPEANEAALAKVRADKEREARDGHDGTWVAHPGLVQIALDVFNEHMPTPNQIHRQREDVNPTAADLLRVSEGTITDAGLRVNVDVGIQYLAAWLGGNGCVPIYNLMEDAATAEISRTQVWQWIRHGSKTAEGTAITAEYVRSIIKPFSTGSTAKAAELFEQLVTAPTLEDFLTTKAYNALD